MKAPSGTCCGTRYVAVDFVVSRGTSPRSSIPRRSSGDVPSFCANMFSEIEISSVDTGFPVNSAGGARKRLKPGKPTRLGSLSQPPIRIPNFLADTDRALALAKKEGPGSACSWSRGTTCSASASLRSMAPSLSVISPDCPLPLRSRSHSNGAPTATKSAEPTRHAARI